jgi:adenylylsulfate kinase
MNSPESQGLVVWLTGLPCAGKSTLAHALRERGRRVEIVDGEVVRRELSGELGYSKRDRHVHVRRVGFMAELLAGNANFWEVYMECPLDECERHDVQGMYALARAGKIADFTGIDGPDEAPANPELRIDTRRPSLRESVLSVLQAIERPRHL